MHNKNASFDKKGNRYSPRQGIIRFEEQNLQQILKTIVLTQQLEGLIY
jgi:hypothetical protein